MTTTAFTTAPPLDEVHDAFPCPPGHDCAWCRPLRIAGWWQPLLASVLLVGFLGGLWLLFPAGLYGGVR